jgi:hypothetical protein
MTTIATDPAAGTSPRTRAFVEFLLDTLVWRILAVVLVVCSLTVPN